MYIAPNTTIKIYKSVPLDITYANTIYFESATAQQNYFHGSIPVKYTLNNNTYQRVDNNTIRVGVGADKLYDCNYLAFKNSSYEDKWFYAFITGIDYVNNDTANVHYMIDSLQTYFFNIGFKMCLVEREHVDDDTIGLHTLPESVATGVLKTVDINNVFYKNFYAIVASTMDLNDTTSQYETPVVGSVYGNVFSGVKLYGFNLSDTVDRNNLIQTLTNIGMIGKSDIIVGMYQVPAEFVRVDSSTHEVTQLEQSYRVTKQIAYPLKDSQGRNVIDGHVVRNNKLLCYPYSAICVTNLSGNGEVYQPELFGNGVAFDITGIPVQGARLKLEPDYYNNTDNLSYDMAKGVLAEPYPSCSWNINSYANYMARLLTQTNATVDNGWIAQAFAGGLSMATSYGKAWLTKSNTMQNVYERNVYNSASEVAQAPLNNWASAMQNYEIGKEANKILGNGVGGLVANGGINVGQQRFGFNIETKCVKKEYAEMIDQYFDKYGYRVNVIKDPMNSIGTRPHWNYIKTSGCIAYGNAPADELAFIEGIFNNGITFWKNASEVGDYDLNNTI